MRNNGSDLSRFEKLPLFCDFVGSMYRVFYVDRNLLTKKRTGNLEAPRDEKYNQLSDEIWISTWKNTESKTTLPWKTNSSFSSAPLNRWVELV